jgi:hypothetical protein
MSNPLSVTLVAQDEETWHSQWQRSRGFRDSGNEDEFLKTALEAFRLRPHRAEPLHDLARFYLGKSRGDIVYADAGLSLPFPEGDRLGVEQAVYHSSLKEAFTIAASRPEIRLAILDWRADRVDTNGKMLDCGGGS